MAVAHRLLKPLRTLHLYLGVFTTPALLLLAFTGGLQSVNLHETTRGSDYKPPAWIIAMAHMHKKQTFEVPAKRPPAKNAVANTDVRTGMQAAPRPADKPQPRRHNPGPMKLFFVAVSLSLLLSTLTGVYMGWRYTRNRRRYGAVLAAGVVVPALLMLF
ncbi:MAG: PepSY domain-containing protein [Rhodanobacteraceae bacterium]